MSNPCPNETSLSAFMDGELSTHDTAEMRRHLNQCHACRHKIEELIAADGFMVGIPAIEPSAEFERTFWRKVAQWEERPSLRWWHRWVQPVWRPVLAVCLVGGLVLGAMHLLGPEPYVSPAEQFMADNMELLHEFDLILNLEILENWDALEALKEKS